MESSRSETHRAEKRLAIREQQGRMETQRRASKESEKWLHQQKWRNEQAKTEYHELTPEEKEERAIRRFQMVKKRQRSSMVYLGSPWASKNANLLE